jgi:hypothetical protein
MLRAYGPHICHHLFTRHAECRLWFLIWNFVFVILICLQTDSHLWLSQLYPCPIIDWLEIFDSSSLASLSLTSLVSTSQPSHRGTWSSVLPETPVSLTAQTIGDRRGIILLDASVSLSGPLWDRKETYSTCSGQQGTGHRWPLRVDLACKESAELKSRRIWLRTCVAAIGAPEFFELLQLKSCCTVVSKLPT